MEFLTDEQAKAYGRLQGEFETIQKHLQGMSQVIEAFTTTGAADVQCRVAARNTSSLQEILLEISSCPVATRMKSSVILSSLDAQRKVQALDLLDL